MNASVFRRDSVEARIAFSQRWVAAIRAAMPGAAIDVHASCTDRQVDHLRRTMRALNDEGSALGVANQSVTGKK
jgi:hypothetical protein